MVTTNFSSRGGHGAGPDEKFCSSGALLFWMPQFTGRKSVKSENNQIHLSILNKSFDKIMIFINPARRKGFFASSQISIIARLMFATTGEEDLGSKYFLPHVQV
jgi:hypothetical protein